MIIRASKEFYNAPGEPHFTWRVCSENRTNTFVNHTQIVEKVTRHQWILEAAYFKAEARNFAPGKALNDWLEAENDYVKLQIARYLSMTEEDGAMTIGGLQELAKSVGVANADRLNLKIELIQSIQQASHHRPCFRTDHDMTCHEEDCQWRAECRKLIAEWCR